LKIDIIFIDSYHFLLQPLKNLSNTYDIDTLKGYFPHRCNNSENQTLYQFQGCYWHGCRKCNPEEVVRYGKAMEQNNVLRSNGYNVVEKWE
jgi:hypothetical protein